MLTIRIELPAHLRTLAGVGREVALDIVQEHDDAPSLATVLDRLEASYPMLRGTIRDQQTRRRRAFIRFFACEQDLSHLPPEQPLPEPVARGDEPLLVVGAMAGG